MPRYNPFPSIAPSLCVTALRYPEEWAWWRASGWRMMVEDATNGGLLLHSHKAKETGGSVLSALNWCTVS